VTACGDGGRGGGDHGGGDRDGGDRGGGDRGGGDRDGGGDAEWGPSSPEHHRGSVPRLATTVFPAANYSGRRHCWLANRHVLVRV